MEVLPSWKLICLVQKLERQWCNEALGVEECKRLENGEAVAINIGKLRLD